MNKQPFYASCELFQLKMKGRPTRGADYAKAAGAIKRMLRAKLGRTHVVSVEFAGEHSPSCELLITLACVEIDESLIPELRETVTAALHPDVIEKLEIGNLGGEWGDPSDLM